ncbi:serine/threonine-protein kinase [Streptomyces sp. LE64]|uniref:serine/threonine-protein kinase n=1 Tax=Streptomyces sp. LE64 TaxID=3448653 RepID=UPI0040415B86
MTGEPSGAHGGDGGPDRADRGGPEGPPPLLSGRYRLSSRIGEGSTATVWSARDEALRRDVAVKEVRAPAGSSATDAARLYAQVERGAWAAARISHPRVVAVHDVVVQGRRPWIVMELVRGLALSEVLAAEGRLPVRRVAAIGVEVLAALRAAHEVGVLHRDVKPANVLLANDGRVMLSDVGIATAEGVSALTRASEITGSPGFLAPERALGRVSSPESDLWSLGVLLYEAVEGRSPFRRETVADTLRAVVDEEPPPMRCADALEPVVTGLLRKDPAARLSAAGALRELRTVAAGGRREPSGNTAAGMPAEAGDASGEQAAGCSPVTAKVPVTPDAVPAGRDGRALAAAGAAMLVLLVAALVLVLVLR